MNRDDQDKAMRDRLEHFEHASPPTREDMFRFAKAECDLVQQPIEQQKRLAEHQDATKRAEEAEARMGILDDAIARVRAHVREASKTAIAPAWIEESLKKAQLAPVKPAQPTSAFGPSTATPEGLSTVRVSSPSEPNEALAELKAPPAEFHMGTDGVVVWDVPMFGIAKDHPAPQPDETATRTVWVAADDAIVDGGQPAQRGDQGGTA